MESSMKLRYRVHTVETYLKKKQKQKSTSAKCSNSMDHFPVYLEIIKHVLNNVFWHD